MTFYNCHRHILVIFIFQSTYVHLCIMGNRHLYLSWWWQLCRSIVIQCSRFLLVIRSTCFWTGCPYKNWLIHTLKYIFHTNMNSVKHGDVQNFVNVKWCSNETNFLLQSLHHVIQMASVVVQSSAFFYHLREMLPPWILDEMSFDRNLTTDEKSILWLKYKCSKKIFFSFFHLNHS